MELHRRAFSFPAVIPPTCRDRVIAPSLLAADFSRIREEVTRAIQSGADWLHLDIMDGHFVDNISFGPAVVQAVLANSIHRPERCMPTQGHQIYQSEKSALEVPGHGAIPVRRLLSYKKALIEGTKAETVQNALTVYFFVGNQVVTEDHTRRTLIDMADRLTKGEAQRWSYVSVTMLFNNEAQGAARMEGLPTLDEADRLARELLAELVSENLAWKQVLN